MISRRKAILSGTALMLTAARPSQSAFAAGQDLSGREPVDAASACRDCVRLCRQLSETAAHDIRLAARDCAALSTVVADLLSQSGPTSPACGPPPE